MNRTLLETILVKSGYNVCSVGSGEEALGRIHAKAPALILLDFQMPRMDGLTLCRTLKEDEGTRDIPVIFISARGDVFDKVKAFEAGAVDYVTKPFHPAEVLARVGTHLKLLALQRKLEEQVADLDAFSRTVAHDLKNPIALVASYADYFAQYHTEMTTEEMGEISHNIWAMSMKSARIVDELLLLSNVHKAQVPIQPLTMDEIVHQSQERLELIIGQHDALIELPDAWQSALGYAPWVEEVWTNYLSNGIKYGGTPPRLQLGSNRQTNGAIRYWVRDNGAGITREEQQRLFAEHERLEKNRAVDGNGLGLSIVKRIVRRLGGTVGVESTPGSGSLFFFTLPAASA
jgi:light-regulated signal transduction histidine kinase (bacteriophytochrome)